PYRPEDTPAQRSLRRTCDSSPVRATGEESSARLGSRRASRTPRMTERETHPEVKTSFLRGVGQTAEMSIRGDDYGSRFRRASAAVLLASPSRDLPARSFAGFPDQSCRRPAGSRLQRVESRLLQPE